MNPCKFIIVVMLISLLVAICGCNSSDSSINKCTVMPKVYWGEAGDNPSDLGLHDCYDWVLKAREIE